MPDVIMFCFAGREPNMRLQLPFIRRILDEHPNIRWDCWNFAGNCGIGGNRQDSDRDYVASISGERIRVINDHGPMQHNEAYRYYASNSAYRDVLFVKHDDDVVFWETARFDLFLDAVDKHRGACVTANVVHNGACAPLQPTWRDVTRLNVPILDIHKSQEFGDVCHRHFLDHPDAYLRQTPELIRTDDWLSINLVGYDWPTLRYCIDTIGTPHPEYLAGRHMLVKGKWHYGKTFGDEGTFQTLNRIIVKGFCAVHLTYGPQRQPEPKLARWRARYARVGADYLAEAAPETLPLPALSPDVVRGYTHEAPPPPPDWHARYRGDGWSRRKIMRTVANSHRGVVNKIGRQNEAQTAEMFARMMSCPSEAQAAQFARQWAACTNTKAERDLILAWWPDEDTDYGL